jgi:SAM-dependent methyltransferase
MAHSKQEAWTPRSDEIRIPLDLKDFKYKFTRKWFIYRNLTTWSSFLPSRFPADQPIKMIQIGVFEGMDLLWCFQNLLKHSQSHVFAVDPWAATTKLDQEYMDSVRDRAHHNLRKYRENITFCQNQSQVVLASFLPQMANKFDLIVIDGDHNAPAVLEDARLAYQLLKPGGWMLFDDYHNDHPKKNHVQDGVAQFLEEHGDGVSQEWYHRYCVCYSKNQPVVEEDIEPATGLPVSE